MSHDTESDRRRHYCRDCSVFRIGVRQAVSAMYERRHKAVGRQDLPEMPGRNAAEGRGGVLVLKKVGCACIDCCVVDKAWHNSHEDC